MPGQPYDDISGVSALLKRPQTTFIDPLAFARGAQMARDVDWQARQRQLRSMQQSDWEEDRTRNRQALETNARLYNERQRLMNEGMSESDAYIYQNQNLQNSLKDINDPQTLQTILKNFNKAVNTSAANAIASGNYSAADDLANNINGVNSVNRIQLAIAMGDTGAALQAMLGKGAQIQQNPNGTWLVQGRQLSNDDAAAFAQGLFQNYAAQRSATKEQQNVTHNEQKFQDARALENRYKTAGADLDIAQAARNLGLGNNGLGANSIGNNGMYDSGYPTITVPGEEGDTSNVTVAPEAGASNTATAATLPSGALNKVAAFYANSQNAQPGASNKLIGFQSPLFATMTAKDYPSNHHFSDANILARAQGIRRAVDRYNNELLPKYPDSPVTKQYAKDLNALIGHQEELQKAWYANRAQQLRQNMGINYGGR